MTRPGVRLRRRSFVWLRNHIANPVVRTLARTPGHRLLGTRLVVLTYSGRRTGHRHELPVMSAPLGDDLVVVAGSADGKTWWRNFGADPQEVSVRRGGRAWTCTARRLQNGDGGYREAVAAYRRAFPRGGIGADPPVVLLEALRPSQAR